MQVPIETAQSVADRLGQIDGVVAVVLGGSRTRGTASPDSDIDLGIYYDPDQRPALEALRALAQELNDQPCPYRVKIRLRGNFAV